ncbi:MAG TPA: hypothetical protein PKC40_08625 [Saprospiraceae bacterium]|nr:hypothetical protein [Saprospiraceae bacterium]
MNNLEKFIRENRADFDKETPGLKVWANISKELEKQKTGGAKTISIKRYLSIAAAALVLLTIGGLAGSYFKGQPIPAIAIQNTPELPPEFQEMEDFYRHQYEQQVRLLANYQVDPAFKDDLKQFEEVMETLKTELQNAPKGNEERIVTAIIQNYQAKIEILQRILERIQTTNPKTTKLEKDEVSL